MKPNYKMLSFIIFILCWGIGWFPIGYGSVPGQNELKVVQQEFRQHQGYLENLAKGLSSLERDLGTQSAHFYSALRKQREIEILMANAENDVFSSEERLKRQYAKVKKILRQNLLGQLVEDSSGGEVLANQYAQKQLKQLVAQFEKEIEMNKVLQNDLSKLRERLNDYQSVELELQGIVRELESKKKNMAENYWKEMSAVDKLREQMVEERRKWEENRKKVGRSTPSPAILEKNLSQNEILKSIQNFSKIADLAQCSDRSLKEKSIELVCKSGTQISAPAKGKVAYSGELSTFGKVVLIDHGGDLRTVVIGDLVPRVEKGQEINQKDIIAIAEKNGSRLSFEIRRKNIALKTSLWPKAATI